jgi:hypothetical protein
MHVIAKENVAPEDATVLELVITVMLALVKTAWNISLLIVKRSFV